MLTHSHCHDFVLLIPICEEVKKIYRDHSHHPKILLHHTNLYYTTSPLAKKHFLLLTCIYNSSINNVVLDNVV